MSAVDGEVSLTEYAINNRLDEMLNNLKKLYIKIIGNAIGEEAKFNKINAQSELIEDQLTEIGNELINIIDNYKGTNIENIEKKYIEIRTEIENNHMPKYELEEYRSAPAVKQQRDNYFKRLNIPFSWFQSETIKYELMLLESKINRMNKSKGGKKRKRTNKKRKQCRRKTSRR
jgi:hypothetical protein